MTSALCLVKRSILYCLKYLLTGYRNRVFKCLAGLLSNCARQYSASTWLFSLFFTCTRKDTDTLGWKSPTLACEYSRFS